MSDYTIKNLKQLDDVEEVYVVISGSGWLKLDDEIVDVQQWDVIRVAPAVIRASRAGPTGSR